MKDCQIFTIILVITAFVASGFFLASCNSAPDQPTVDNVDLKRYMGQWHEIARFENWFERGKFDASAEYSLKDDGSVKVVNSSTNGDGSKSSVEGSAYVPDKRDCSKLRVTFFPPFYGDYWILELDAEYRWVLVGGRDPNYLWILARSPTLSPETVDMIVALAKRRGYDISNFVFNDDLKKTTGKK